MTIVCDIGVAAVIMPPLIYQYFQRNRPMTKPMTKAVNDHDIGADMTPDTSLPATPDTLHRPHTIASITLEAGSTKRTVRRWLAKCGDIGTEKNGTRYFSDAEKERILSHQRRSATTTEETIEAELVEPGAIELHTGDASAAAPLVAFNIESIQITLKGCDTSALDMQSAQFEQVSSASANAIANAISAELIGDIAQVRAKQKNLVAGIEAQALANVAKALSGEATGK